MKSEILLYQSDELPERIEVKIEDETVWLSQKQMSSLFAKNIMTINEHIKNVYEEGELEEISTLRKSLIVQKEGRRNVRREVMFYNLDVIISVGYRVKSKQGTQFRIWATNVLRDYLLKGYALNQRMNRIENTVEHLADKVNEISFQIKSTERPTQGVFFDGQIFDAYELASKIIRSAKKSIVLIDNYIDENTLTHLSKKTNSVKVLLLTKNSTKQLELDVKKANEQYSNFEIKTFSKSHDRFLIIDNTEVYHLGASLKDLGKKWFAFSKMDKHSIASILSELGLDRLKDDGISSKKKIQKSVNPKNQGSDNGEWVEKKLGEHIDLFSGIALKSEEISDDESGTPILRGINITEGFIRHSKDINKYFLGVIENLEKYLVKKNDIVIGMDGSKVGKNVALIEKEDDNSILIQRVARIRTKKNADIHFVYQYFISDIFRNYVDRVNTSSGIPHISAQQIKDFKVGFPSKLAEQQKIASCLSSLDALITAQAEKIEQLQLHKKGLMQGLFPKMND